MLKMQLLLKMLNNVGLFWSNDEFKVTLISSFTGI